MKTENIRKCVSFLDIMVIAMTCPSQIQHFYTDTGTMLKYLKEWVTYYFRYHLELSDKNGITNWLRL